MPSAPRRATLATVLAAAAFAPAAAAAPATVPPVPFADADAANSLDLTPLPDGRVAFAWTHAVSRNGVGFALRRPNVPLGPSDAQDLTRENSSVLGPVPPVGDAPYLLLRADDSTLFTHSLQSSTLDGGLPQNFAFVGIQSFEACPDGTWSVVTQTAPSGSPASQRLVIRRYTTPAAFASAQNFTGTHDDDGIFPGVVLSCEAGRLLLAANRDTDPGAGETEALTVHAFAGTTTTSTELIRITAAAGTGHGTVRLAEQPGGRVWAIYETGADGPGPYGVGLATSTPGDPLVTAPITELAGADLRDVTVDAAGRLLVLYDQHPPGSTDNDDPGIPTVGTIEPGSTALVATPLSAVADDRNRSLLRGHPDGRPRLVTTFSDGDVPPSDDSVTISGLPGAPGQATDPPVVARAPAAPGLFPGSFAGTYLPGGDLVAVWQDGGNPGGKMLQGGIDSGAPPSLGTVQVPAVAVAGEPVVLEAAPSDPMGLQDSGWIVDGATIPGANVRTTFASAGTRTVTAFAVDRAGNRTETSRTIRVLPADAVAPGGAPPAPTTPVAADVRRPRITALSQTPSRLSRRATVLRVRVRTDETSAVDLELRGRLRRGRERATLVLSTARVARLAAGRTRTVRLRVPRGLLRFVEGGRLDVRAIATDLAGNRGTRTVRVRRR